MVRGEHRNAFAVVRPPGHHAGERGSTSRDGGAELVGQGFCLINHVAVGARYALGNHGAAIKRVAVVDWDLHHGNGTEQILSDGDGPLARDGLRDAVLFASIHGAGGGGPGLFPGTATEPSASPAVNVPLPKGTAPADFLDAFRGLLARVEAFDPDLVLVSAGFDAHKDDMFRYFKLTERTYKTMTELARPAAPAAAADARP